MFHRLSSLALLSLAASCVDATTDDAFVFGLSADEVLAAKRVAHTDLTDAAWLDAHRGDFDCARYGDLCRLIGRDAAADVIELGYRLALDGADRDAIRIAQEEALVAAQAIAPDPLVPFASNTEYAFGGSTNKRLKIVASATKMWPSLELRAQGSCTFQKSSFGWWNAHADRISGTLTATYDGTTIRRDDSVLVGETHVDLGPFQLDADTLTVRVTCAASEDVWSASGTSTLSI